MTHHLIPGYIYGRPCWQIEGYEPSIHSILTEAGQLLATGRRSIDPPGTRPAPLDDWIEQVPHTVLVKKLPRSGIPDFEFGNFVTVSDRMRETLEKLEPGLHRFLPVRIVDGPTGKRPGHEHGTAWLVHLTEAPDIIDHDRTWYSSREVPGRPGVSDRNGVPSFSFISFLNKPDNEKTQSVIAFRPGADGRGVEGRHLWRGTVGRAGWHRTGTIGREGPYMDLPFWHDTLRKELFVSDELAMLMKQRGMTGWIPVPIADPDYANRIGRAGEFYCGYKPINDPEVHSTDQ